MHVDGAKDSVVLYRVSLCMPEASTFIHQSEKFPAGLWILIHSNCREAASKNSVSANVRTLQLIRCLLIAVEQSLVPLLRLHSALKSFAGIHELRGLRRFSLLFPSLGLAVALG